MIVCALAVVGVFFWFRGAVDDELSDNCYYEKCNNDVRIVPGKPFDPSDFVEDAVRMAEALEPEAKLSVITFAGLRDGLFMDKIQSPVAFTFTYPVRGGGTAQVVVAVNGHQMMARHAEAPGGLPTVPAPRCTFREAFRAANGGGVFDGELVTGLYADNGGRALWTISTKTGSPLRYVDGDCRAFDAKTYIEEAAGR